jgi:gelsolin
LYFKLQNKVVVPVQKKDYGKFYSGDSYIVYSASEEGQKAGVDIDVRDIDGDMDVYVHHWMGLKSSTDEIGIAAFKASELYNSLSTSSGLIGEQEGKETDRFKGYFGNNMRYVKQWRD